MKQTNVERLKSRIAQNHEDFYYDTLETLDKEDIYKIAAYIAAVETVRHFMEHNQDFGLDEGDENTAAYLLMFDNPLEMLADALPENMQGLDEIFVIRMALENIFDNPENEENYLSAAEGDMLRDKYGCDVPIFTAILCEVVELGKQFLRYSKILGEDAPLLGEDEPAYENDEADDEDGRILFDDEP